MARGGKGRGLGDTGGEDLGLGLRAGAFFATRFTAVLRAGAFFATRFTAVLRAGAFFATRFTAVLRAGAFFAGVLRAGAFLAVTSPPLATRNVSRT